MSDKKKTDPARLRRGPHSFPISVEVEPDGPGGQVDGLALEVEALAARRSVAARDVLEAIVTDAVVEAIELARNRGQRRRLEALEKETAKLREALGGGLAVAPPHKIIGVDPGEPEPASAAPRDVDDEDYDEADEPEAERDPESRWAAAKGRK